MSLGCFVLCERMVFFFFFFFLFFYFSIFPYSRLARSGKKKKNTRKFYHMYYVFVRGTYVRTTNSPQNSCLYSHCTKPHKHTLPPINIFPIFEFDSGRKMAFGPSISPTLTMSPTLFPPSLETSLDPHTHYSTLLYSVNIQLTSPHLTSPLYLLTTLHPYHLSNK